MNKTEVAVIGSGMGAVSAACLLAKAGFRGAIFEQNYLPGGCTSAYWRKGFVFESGATTLVGLDRDMPLRHLLDEIGIALPALSLALPMRVQLADGTMIRRYQPLEAWIAEAERVFGVYRQRPFWEFCYRVSQFVWQTSLRQRAFPPTSLTDLWQCAMHASPQQLGFAPYALRSTEWLLSRYDLHHNQAFVDFVNQQLLITAQNYAPEVNVLFGATALCYTNYGNYYLPGGLIGLVNPLLEYLQQKGWAIHLREGVRHVQRDAWHGDYRLQTTKGSYRAEYLISGIPIDNTLQLYEGVHHQRLKPRLVPSAELNSAFQMGIAFRCNHPHRFDTIHHQIHLPVPLPHINARSIFVSLNHPDDTSRSDTAGVMVASVSTHIPNPAATTAIDKHAIAQTILQVLEERGFFERKDVVYQHASTQEAWEKWTGRAWGFVGGYPQLMRVKPWQMLDARLDGHKAYLCGDTVYPGQGIPGVVLSGIIAAHKLQCDWGISQR